MVHDDSSRHHRDFVSLLPDLSQRLSLLRFAGVDERGMHR
jgi:hypothetical protein